MTGWRPFHRRSPQRFTLDQLGDVFLIAFILVLLVVAASMDWGQFRRPEGGVHPSLETVIRRLVRTQQAEKT
jgi:hypothetical protein